jgi:5-methylcytosine-specific restriction endonuclease McrA
VKFPKPKRRAGGKGKSDRVNRRLARLAVFKRENSQCERCRRYVSDDVSDASEMRAHVNEIVPLSLGGSPTDLANLELTCRACHLPKGQHAPTKARMRKILGGSA